MALIGWLYRTFVSPEFDVESSRLNFLMKMPTIVFDMLIVVVIMVYAARQRDTRAALLAGAAYAFNPGVIYTTAYNGQLGDPLYALFVTLAVVALGLSGGVADEQISGLRIERNLPAAEELASSGDGLAIGSDWGGGPVRSHGLRHELCTPSWYVSGVKTFVSEFESVNAWIDRYFSGDFSYPVLSRVLPGEIGKLVIKGTKITMQAPKRTGYTNDSRPYEFTADTAAQDINKPDVVEMQKLHARLQMEDKRTVEMTAPSGTYDMKADRLVLQDDIALASSTGYAARLEEAIVDMHSGNVVSNKPVKVKLLNGFLDAKRLEISESGAVIRFDGGVSMVLRPDQDPDKAKTQ